MNRTAAEENLEAKAQLFKALAHPTRLLILNLVQRKARHGEELAAILGLNPATISHHLSKLSSAGLLNSKKDQYYQTYKLTGGLLQKTLGEIVHLPQAELVPTVETDAYKTKVLGAFFKHGRLTRIPTQLKKRAVVLEKIAQEFEPERTYSEKEINLILLDFYQDVATLRRELVDIGLLKRKQDLYRRNKITPGETR
jgi:biotin operon repressor